MPVIIRVSNKAEFLRALKHAHLISYGKPFTVKIKGTSFSACVENIGKQYDRRFVRIINRVRNAPKNLFQEV